MHKRSISVKIIIYTSVMMAVLLLLKTLVLFSYEKQHEKRFATEYREQMEKVLQEREQYEIASLKKNVAFNTKVIAKIAAPHIYSLNLFGIREVLQSYLEYPEILAVQVMDDKQKPFAAVYRNAETIKEKLPDTFKRNEALSVTADCRYDDQKVGSIQVYYSEDLLKQDIAASRKAGLSSIASFNAAARTRLRNAMTGQLVGTLFIILVLIASQYLLLKWLIFKRVADVSDIARRLSRFDLNVALKIGARDEIGTMLAALDEMITSFKGIIRQVQHSGVQVNSSATELAATAKQQEVTMKQQVTSINDVISFTKEISTASSDLVHAMQQVSTMSQEASDTANSSQEDLILMGESVQHMETASRSISGRLEIINEKTENITTVVTTITKVADQTNLLSLNAAIEAEKAREYGRGFTVVAREIRRLADQTAVATLDIEQMVKEMQSSVASGVMEMDKFIAAVRNNARDVDKIRSKLTHIINQVQALSPNFETVNEAVQHQSRNEENINQSLQQLSEEMQQTKDSLDETYSVIEQLNEASTNLRDEVSQFKL
jgi:methyl-accepting chemotaxis protein WspA